MKRFLIAILLIGFSTSSLMSSGGFIPKLPPKKIQEIVVKRYIPPKVVVLIPTYINIKLRQFVVNECERLNLPQMLVYKLIEKESKWRQKLHSENYRKGKIDSIDFGIMQLNNKYHEEFIWRYKSLNRKISSYDVIKNSYDNIEIGLSHLAKLVKLTGSYKEAIIAYNCGYTLWQTGNIPKSTIQYVNYIIPYDNWYLDKTNIELDFQ